MTLRLPAPPGLPRVGGDRVHLQQVLLNLLVNGADALNGSPIGQRDLVIRARLAANRTVEVAVRDTGHGIPEAHLSRLFEPFFTTRSDGMGMGLAISKAIVDSHGGRIWAENNTEGGSTVRFSLRVADQEGQA